MTSDELFKPFSAFRPKSYEMEQILAPPYETLTEEEVNTWISGKPHHFLRLTHSSPEEALHLFQEWCDEGVFERDPESAYYLYELETPSHRQRGWVGALDLTKSVIHTAEPSDAEQIMAETNRVNMLKMHVRPISLCYTSKKPPLKDLAEQMSAKQKPVYTVQTPDGVWHRIYRVESEEAAALIAEQIQAASYFYVMDGQSTYQAAMRTGLREILAVVFPSDELKIEAYHRWIPEPDCTFQGLIQFLGRYCVFETMEKLTLPKVPGEVILQWNGKAFRLRFRSLNPEAHQAENDAERLHELFLKPFFKIDDERTDPRLSFVAGKTTSELSALSGLLILLYPRTVASFIDGASAQKTARSELPCTASFYPKLAEGIWVLPTK